MKRLRVTLVAETWFPQVNGVSRTLEKLADYLRARGDAVQLLVPRYGGQAPAAPAGAETVAFPSLPLPGYPEVRVLLATPGQVRRHLRRFGPDLVHVATEGPLGWAALRAARCLGLPAVSSYHTNFAQYLRLYGLGALEGTAWRYLRRFHNATRRTFCPTPSIRGVLETKGFRRVGTWSRGVDGQRFHPQKRDATLRRQWGVGPEETVLVYAGRLAAEKNLEMLLQAWRLLSVDGCRLLLIGDGPLRGALEGLGDERVIFAGYRQGEDLARTYASADLFVFPSLTETFGNVVLEAMASGLPAVGFRVPGPQDIIRDGETGVLVETVDAGSLARTAAGLLADPRRRLRMARQARAYAETQSWPAILGRLREEYGEVLSCCADEKRLNCADCSA